MHLEIALGNLVHAATFRLGQVCILPMCVDDESKMDLNQELNANEDHLISQHPRLEFRLTVTLALEVVIWRIVVTPLLEVGLF